MKLQEDKTRFINNLPWNSKEEKSKVLDFFKNHANLESKIQNWQSKDKENLINEIRNLISETEKASLEKEKTKQGYRGNIDWEAHDCKYLGEDEDWIYITPISWKGGKFCDSAECGGAGAKWCIGYEKSSMYWMAYRKKNTLFLMKFNKHPRDKQKDLKFMIEGHLDKSEIKIWDQTDKSQSYLLSSQEEVYLQKVKNYWVEERKQKIALYFDNPEPGTYVAKNEKAIKHIKDIKKDLKVFKVKEGVIFQNIKDASSMFKDCILLTSIDTSGFVNVENASRMFYGCTSLTSIDTSAFKKVKNASDMFYQCRSLTSIDTSTFGNIETATGMFARCSSLNSIDTFIFGNVKDASWMFQDCTSLTLINTSAFMNVENAEGMFYQCKSLTSIDTSTFENVKGANYMFARCTSLTSIDTSVFENAENARSMFLSCESLTSIDTYGFKNVKDAREMFKDCNSLKSIDASAFVSVRWGGMFEGCKSLKTYIPGSNSKINGELELIGAKPVKKLGESFRRKMIEEILED